MVNEWNSFAVNNLTYELNLNKLGDAKSAQNKKIICALLDQDNYTLRIGRGVIIKNSCIG